jgi:DNA-binding transcriptional MerR regulator
MTVSIPDKSYFRIGEVGKLLGVEPYVIRFWEAEFNTVRPIRSKKDQRLYRRKDVEELLTIKTLLYEDMFTIAGAKKQLARRRKAHGADDNDTAAVLLAVRKELREIKDIIG